MDGDVTIEVLKSIRDEIKSLRNESRSGLNDVRGELSALNDRVDRIERRQTDSDVRLSTEIIAVVGVLEEMKALLRENLDIRSVV